MAPSQASLLSSATEHDRAIFFFHSFFLTAARRARPALSALQALPSSKEKLLGLVNLGKYGCVCILARDATKTVPGDV